MQPLFLLELYPLNPFAFKNEFFLLILSSNTGNYFHHELLLEMNVHVWLCPCDFSPRNPKELSLISENFLAWLVYDPTISWVTFGVDPYLDLEAAVKIFCMFVTNKAQELGWSWMGRSLVVK